MLTDEALFKRKWGSYPSLGELLGKHPVPSHHFGPTSVSDNVFSGLLRLAEVAILTEEHADTIRTVTDSEAASRLPKDLDRLQGELHAAGRFFTDHAEFVRTLCEEAHEREYRRRHESQTRRSNPNGHST